LDYTGLLANFGGGKTLKFEGALRDIPVIILIDSGASHNFISRRLSLALGLPISAFEGIRIKLGDGHSIVVTERCMDIPVTIGPCTFVLNALVLDMVWTLFWVWLGCSLLGKLLMIGTRPQ
jgi:hypothetical protein